MKTGRAARADVTSRTLADTLYRPRAVPRAAARSAVHGLATVAALGCGALAAGVSLAATRLGAGVTPDTGHYLAVADNLLAGRGFVRLGPEIMASWPPMFPLLLAAGQAAGFDVLTWARAANAILFAGCAALVASWIASRTGSRVAGALAGIAIAVGPPLVYVSSLALSEMLFITFVLLTLRALDSWLERPDGRRLALCGAALALACLTRYQGLAAVAAVGLLVLALGPGTIAARVKTALIVCGGGVLPVALWIARNVWLTGNPMGPRFASEYTATEAAADLGRGVMAWFLPWRVLLAHEFAGLACVIALCAIAGIVAFRRTAPVSTRPAAVGVAFILGFAVLMLRAVTTTSMDPLADRILSPVYPSIVLIVATAGAFVAERASGRMSLAVRAAVLLAAVGTLAVVGARTTPRVVESWYDGPGGVAHTNFNRGYWRSSPTLLWAGQRLQGSVVYASAPAALYLTAGVDSRPMPRKHARRAPNVPLDRLDDLQRDVSAAGRAFLVVTDAHVPSHTFPIAELEAALDVKEIATFADGRVYELRASRAGIAEP